MSLIPGLDRKDQFQKGHLVRGAPKSSWRKRAGNIPAWALDNESIKQLLLKIFPKMNSNRRQRDSAGRWAAVIHLYFRAARPALEVADTLKIPEKKVYDTVLRIKRAAKGLRTTGRNRTAGKPGRPRRRKFF
jgi:hypothetical protein